jgi:hypothetical protein
MKRIILTVAAFAAITTGGIAAASPAFAAAAPKITGSFALAAPDQWESINNAQASGSGSLSYTNFDVADVANSGVWSLRQGQPIAVTFGLGGGTYPHHLTVDSIQPTGLNSFTFTGHGNSDNDSSTTWTASGSVSGTTLNMHIVYTGSSPDYSVDLTGAIAADGSVSGSATSSTGQQLSLAMPTGSLFQALSYTAPVSGVVINGTSGDFNSAIPAGHIYAGTGFHIHVADGGSPGASHDSYAQDGTTYTITAGNLTVH